MTLPLQQLHDAVCGRLAGELALLDLRTLRARPEFQGGVSAAPPTDRYPFRVGTSYFRSRPQDREDLDFQFLVAQALYDPHQGHDLATFELRGGDVVVALDPLVLPLDRESEAYERELLEFVERACCLIRAMEPTVVRVLTESLEWPLMINDVDMRSGENSGASTRTGAADDGPRDQIG